MIRVQRPMLGVILMLAIPSLGGAATCTIVDITYTCDIQCTPNCSPSSFASCDSNTTDGVCVLCGNTSANTITGTDGDDVVCGKGGDDTIDTGAGNDVIDGGGGTDIIYAGIGHDEVYGGTGDDYIVGQGGNDSLNGGAGDDTIQSGTGFADASTHGANVCGGKDDDTITGFGHGHQCIDGGTGTDDCTYVAPIAPTGNKTAGSYRYCETTHTDSNSATFLLADALPCGCTGDQ